MSKSSGHRFPGYHLILWALILPLALAPLAAMANPGGEKCCCQTSAPGSCCQASGDDDCCQGMNPGHSGCQCPASAITFLLPEHPQCQTSHITPFVMRLASPSIELFYLDIFHPPRS